MSQQFLNTGSSANDGTGDTLRSGALKINANFTELYASSSFQLPTQIGNAGLFLSTNGTTLTWANPSISAFPSQTGQTGKFLTTNGTAVSWANIVVSNANTVTNGVYTSSSYSDPSWITSLSGTKVTNAVLTTGSYIDPSWISSLSGSKISGTITATNGVVTNGVYSDPTWITSLAGSKISGNISGNAGTVTNGVYTNGSYSNPSWITSLGETKVLPTQTGNSGKFLTTNGTASSWTTIESFPAQTGNSGKFLTTNGTAISWGTVSGLSTRTTVTTTTASLANNANANANITGYKSYALLKIQTSAAAWVRIYSDAASRTADASRASNTDPAPGAGIITEVITTGAQTILISPGAFGFNNESSPTTNIPVNITNLSGSAAAITVTLTVLQLEA